MEMHIKKEESSITVLIYKTWVKVQNSSIEKQLLSLLSNVWHRLEILTNGHPTEEELTLPSLSLTLGPRLKQEHCRWIRCPGITGMILSTTWVRA